MKGVLFTRFLRWKKEWKSLLFWLMLPVALTIFTVQLVGSWSQDTKVPIAIVVEQKTGLTNHFIENVQKVPYLNVKLLDEKEALNQLEKHELDSVFILAKDYEDMVKDGQNKRLIEAYSSNRSIAYFAVVELIKATAQDEVSRSKAAYEVKKLFEQYGMDEEWNWEEVVQASKEKQQSQQLLQTSFNYYDEDTTGTNIVDTTTPMLFQIWGIWALCMMISTFFLFDWVLKEKRKEIQMRWIFTSYSFKKYAMYNLIVYTVLLLSIDAIGLILISAVLQESLNISTILSIFFFRIVVNLSAFLFAQLFRKQLQYYVSSIGMTLILILLGGGILPIEGVIENWHWAKNISPVHSLIIGEIPSFWLCFLLVMLLVWFGKGEKRNA